MTNADLIQEYDALKNGCGMVRLTNWSLLELTGADRKSFLHNFCTADVKALEDGKTTEAFVLNGKGKILGFVHVAALADRLLLAGAGAQAKALIEHLDKYIIREDVTIKDLFDESEFVFVGGTAAASNLKEAFQVELEFGGTQDCTTGSGINFAILHGEIAGPGFLLLVNKKHYSKVVELVGGCTACTAEALEVVRLEHGTPWFDAEVDQSCLPQEIDRDEKAINFNKGCYLGQETVARIDALGRVNRLLRFATVGEATPKLGQEVCVDDKTVGTVLSTAKIPGTTDSIFGVLVKRSASVSGTKVKLGDHEATIR